MYRRRTVDTLLDSLLPNFSAVALDGVTGVGKTSTALQRADHVFHLEHQDQRSLIGADPSTIRRPGTTLLDEWPRMARVWDLTRRHIDDGAPPGTHLLTGPPRPRSDEHIPVVRMRPMSLHERGLTTPSVSLATLLAQDSPCTATIDGHTSWTLTDYLQAIESSGFPGIMNLEPEQRTDMFAAHIRRVIDHELPEAGHNIRRPKALRRWLAAYATTVSTTASCLKLLTTTEGERPPSHDAALHYQDHLTELGVLEPVPGWNPRGEPIARLQQAPKHQLVDPALTAFLLGATAASMSTPHHSHLAGPLFESLATLTVRVAAEVLHARVGHLRSRNRDREVDLIVEAPDGRLVAIEVKLSTTVTEPAVQHLLWLRSKLPQEVADLVVLTTGNTAYRRRDGVAVVPLALLGA
ncbi:MAG: DUF4143 domain-containing protein [Propionibacteriaceae bacterium]|nr:DUF4143 domain-containing protein [Propionibacteriaceae bacterium]